MDSVVVVVVAEAVAEASAVVVEEVTEAEGVVAEVRTLRTL